MSRVIAPRPVGIVGPLTGPRAAYGEWLRRAAQGSALPLVWADDAADPVAAVDAAHRLLAAGAEVVIGHFNSECARAAGALYRAAGVPLLLPAATAADLCQSVGAFRLCAS
ncbi:ABC transporter substrate-binding protein, partial [Pseudomonas sp. HMWF006]